MPDYQKGKIYTIRCRDDETLIYVGSSIQRLSVRWGGHKRDMLKKPNRPLYKNMLDKGVDMFYIELYEEYPCNAKEQLRKREGVVIREIGTLNKVIAGRTKKERESDPEYKQKRKEYQQTPEYKQKHKEYKQTPEYKQKQKEYDRARRSTPEYKQKQKERESTPEYKQKKKEYKQTLEYKQKQKEYKQTLEYKQKQKEYNRKYYLKRKEISK